MKKACMVVNTKRMRVAMIPTWAGTKFFFLSFLLSLAVRAGIKSNCQWTRQIYRSDMEATFPYAIKNR